MARALVFTRRGRCLVNAVAKGEGSLPPLRVGQLCPLLVSMYDMMVHPNATDDGAALTLAGYRMVLLRGSFVHVTVAVAASSPSATASLALWSLKWRARAILDAFEHLHVSALRTLFEPSPPPPSPCSASLQL